VPGDLSISSHSSVWTGGATDALFALGAGAVVARGAGGLSVIFALGSATARLRACLVVFDRLEPQECEIDGPAV